MLLYIAFFPVVVSLYFVFIVSLRFPLSLPLFPISRGFVLLF